MSRRQRIIGLAVVGALVLGASLFLWLRPSEPAVEAEAGPGSTAQPALSAQEVQRLEEALVSTDPRLAGESLDPSLRGTYLTGPFSMLPAGATAVIDTGSMVDETTAATVNVAVDGAGQDADGTWLLILTKVDGRWMIAGATRP